MLKAWEFYGLTALAALALLLVVVNVSHYKGNRHLQDKLAAQNAYIQQANQLQALNSGIIQALAELAQKSQDVELRDLLAANGVTFAPAPSPASLKK